MGKCVKWRAISSCASIAAAALLSCTTNARATALTGIQAPYSSIADSPLVTSSAGYSLEAFEPTSPTLASLGVTLTTLHGSSVDPGLSVDADDGSIDGSGAAGHSLTVITAGGTTGATFAFSSPFPKSVGIAVTAAAESPLVFTVFDTSNAVSGTYVIPNISTSTPTSDDFVFWGSDAAGIGSISLTSNGAGTHMHLDHLQFDTLNTIPEPATLACSMIASTLLIAPAQITQIQ